MDKTIINMTLLIDFGNSRIKWIYVNSSNNINIKANNLESFSNCSYGNYTSFKRDVLKKVAKKVLITKTKDNDVSSWLIEFLKKEGIPYDIIKTDTSICHVCYKTPDSFGTDRFLGLLAGKVLTDKSFYVVSAGTAITLDFYDIESNHHLGGVIKLGLASQLQTLSEKTGLPLLKDIEKINKEEPLLGNSTKSCIQQGTIKIIREGIYSIIKEVENNRKKKFHGFYTGGDITTLFPDEKHKKELLFIGMLSYIDKKNIT